MTPVKIKLELPDDEAMALAQLCKRFRWDIAIELSRKDDGGQERDAMLKSLNTLRRFLAEVGYAPR